MGIFGGNAPCSGTQPSLIFAHLLVRGGFTSGTAGLKLYWKCLFHGFPWQLGSGRSECFGGDVPISFQWKWDSLAKCHQEIVNTGWNCFPCQHQHVISTVPPAVSYSAFPLIHTLAVWSLVMFLWNHQWIPQVRFKSRFWMVKSFPDESE